MSNNLLEYWPDRPRVVSVIKTEAEAIDHAVFLAVHQPMRFRIERIGGKAVRAISGDEHDMFKWFVEKNLEEGRRILPIVGSSGIGKSHVIRWLYANLRMGEGAEKRHVIRIPKSSSLKTILGLLLEGLQGERYDEFRERLGKAKDELNPLYAADLLKTHIKNELRKKKDNADIRLGEGGLGAKEKADLKKVRDFCLDRMLPALLSDPTLEREHWGGKSGALSRISAHATKEAERGQTQEGIQFKSADFIFSPDIDLQNLNADAKKCIVHIRRDEDTREIAAGILNSVLDEAKAELMNLGGNSLTDIFRDIRQALFEEDPFRELVLLIEDFAVMMGLQAALFQIMAIEGVRDGKQELCTMRTALAFTPGAVDLPETVKTRAIKQWHLDEKHDDEEYIHQFNCNLIGAYLNATRLGVNNLKVAHEEYLKNESDWPPLFAEEGLEDSDLETLEAFGRANKFLLFPFNVKAIRRLAIEGVSRQGKLVLNPRELINNVLHEVLNYREEYLEGSFPPESLGSGLKNADLALHIKNNAPADKVGNVLQLLAVWADQPQDMTEAATLPEYAYRAFNLPYVKFHLDGPPYPPPKPPEENGKTKPRKPKDDEWPEAKKWEKKLAEWQNGIALVQRDANELRKEILNAVTSSLAWDTMLFKPIKDVISTNVYIPLARGQKDITLDNSIITLCTDKERKNPQTCAPIRLELLALLRQSHYKKWNYKGAEDDRKYYLSFIKKHQEKATKWLSERPLYTGASTGLIQTLVQGLYVSGRLEGRKVQGIKGEVESVSLVFNMNPIEDKHIDDEEWSEVMKKLNALRASYEGEPSWVDMLLSMIGARQGAGSTYHAIDVSKVLPHIQNLLRGKHADKPEFASSEKYGRAARKRVVEGAKNIQITLDRKLHARRNALIEWRTKYIDWSGGKSKDEIVEEIREYLNIAKKNGIVDEYIVQSLRQALSEYKKTAVESELSNVSRLSTDNDTDGIDNVLKAVGLVDDSVVSLISKVVTLTEQSMADTKSRLDTLEETLGGGGVKEAINELDDELTKIQTVFESYERMSK